MLMQVFSIKYVILLIFLSAGAYIHFRGNVRHKFLRQLFDHSTLMAPINVIMYLFSAIPNKPYIDVKQFPQLIALRENWQMMRAEALKLTEQGYIRASDRYDDIGFNSFFKTGWKRFYLKWYGDSLPSAQALCPQTVALLSKIPNINAAMFALLPKNSKLVTHRDPYAGSLRYHLGLITPNSEKCYINVDGITYYWKDGEEVMFDETYIHFAENTTDQDRIILFCDIARPMRNKIATAINLFFCKSLMAASATKNFDTDKVGVINKIFKYLYAIHCIMKLSQPDNRCS